MYIHSLIWIFWKKGTPGKVRRRRRRRSEGRAFVLSFTCGSDGKDEERERAAGPESGKQYPSLPHLPPSPSKEKGLSDGIWEPGTFPRSSPDGQAEKKESRTM